ncbi:rsbT co-antagonist protein RsbR [Deinococcus metalli]|uniref:Polyvinylalcohol dehydrogenase n=1 Tax=Deinococcus metalli TaxID=1141878 RepID=A0A7W8KDY2_9DEIO|nr:STAS domain-containing protein [Deinococcus metalli]MBB5376397.1 rsbT co-antagonist protein RsbR [Deinococcus metalli]GHF44372.1 polyvinylalcohol dehydrogenase [Deinococcus metalli]
MTATTDRIARLLSEDDSFLDYWVLEQLNAVTMRRDLISEVELRRESGTFLTLFRQGVRTGGDIGSAAWGDVRAFLEQLARSRAGQGFTPSEVATFVFSLKQPLFGRLRQELTAQPEVLADAVWDVTVLIDQLGLYTLDVYQKSREQIIERQRQEMLELSTPVVKLWDGVVALPLIGTLDSQRTQIVMETLLQRIVDTGSTIAIIDITGVPTVDTLVAQHLLQTVAAAKLMGADCIISGIRPQIAQTIVHLGIDLSGVSTRASLADALQLALGRGGFQIVSGADA